MNVCRFRLRGWFLALALVGGLGAYLLRSSLPEKIVDDSSEQAGPTFSEVECLGVVDIEGGVHELSTLQAGRVVALSVHESDRVSEGIALLRLDDRAARLRLTQAQAVLEAARMSQAVAEEIARQHPGQLLQQQALLEATQRRQAASRHELGRQEQMLERTLIDKRDVAIARDRSQEVEALVRVEEQKLAALQRHNPTYSVNQARAEVARTQALLDLAQYDLEQCTLRAPETGTVLRIHTGPGAMVGPTKPALLFAPDRPQVVRVEVEQEFISRVRVGQSARVRDALNAKISCQGQVVSVAGWHADRRFLLGEDPQFRDVPTVECLIALDPRHPLLRVGQRVTVRIRDMD